MLIARPSAKRVSSTSSRDRLAARGALQRQHLGRDRHPIAKVPVAEPGSLGAGERGVHARRQAEQRRRRAVAVNDPRIPIVGEPHRRGHRLQHRLQLGGAGAQALGRLPPQPRERELAPTRASSSRAENGLIR